MSAYHVVYEWNNPQKGSYGSRFSVPFESKEAYEASTAPKDASIVEVGVYGERAFRLTSLTPEICRLFNAIENCDFTAGTTVIDAPKQAVIEAHKQIVGDRLIIAAYNLKRHDASPYIQAFEKIAKAGPLTIKSASQLSLLVQVKNQFGEVSDTKRSIHV